MGKYGKKNEVDLNPLHYNICLLGESGIGKTTILKQICEKLVGDEGYIHFDIGREDGAGAIQGLISERIDSWEKLKDVTTDIIENKDSDYPNLQVVIWDTLDELVPLAESEAIRLYNKKNPDKKTDTIMSAWGGFGRGMDKAINLILDEIWELKKVGINSIIVGHVKRTDIIDPITQETYSKLTADSTQRYFNAIKNKMHFVGLAYVDRNIVKEKTGRKDIKGVDIKINKVVSESRVIAFRDDTYSVDSKSRFSDIVDHIPFDADAFIKAMQDAILAERSKSGESLEDAQKRQAERDRQIAKAATEYSQSRRENLVDEEKNVELLGVIKENFASASADQKAEIKKLMAENNIDKLSDSDVPTAFLEKVVGLLS